MGCVKLDDPGAHGFIDGITEGAGSGFDGDDLGTKELDAEDVEGLSSYIFLESCQYCIKDCEYCDSQLPYRLCTSCRTWRRLWRLLHHADQLQSLQ